MSEKLRLHLERRHAAVAAITEREEELKTIFEPVLDSLIQEVPNDPLTGNPIFAVDQKLDHGRVVGYLISCEKRAGSIEIDSGLKTFKVTNGPRIDGHPITALQLIKHHPIGLARIDSKTLGLHDRPLDQFISEMLDELLP